jgi:hypothetical protein
MPIISKEYQDHAWGLVSLRDIGGWAASYASTYAIAKLLRFPKPDQFANYSISMLATYDYLYNETTKRMIAYYLYDTATALLRGDFVYVLHHLGTLYVALTHPNDVDYDRMHRSIKMIKFADLVFYFKKIVDATSYKDNPDAKRFILATQWLSFILWLSYRVVKPCTLYPYSTRTKTGVCMSFHAANVFWTYKMLTSIMRSAKLDLVRV